MIWVLTGAVQFSGAGPVRHLRLPGNTLQIRGQPFAPRSRASLRAVFQSRKKDERSFRGSVSGMGFAYCDFRHQGAAQMLLARAVARPRALHPSGHARSADAAQAEIWGECALRQLKAAGSVRETQVTERSDLRRSTD